MAQPKIMVVPVTPFQQNCSIVWSEETGKGAVFDPGGDIDKIVEAIGKSGAKIEKILLTHGHIDHAGGAAELKERLNIPLEGPHEADKFLLDTLPESGARYGIFGARTVTPDRWLKDGDTISFAGLTFAILHCPGHSPGSVVYHSAEHGFCLMGDVLFRGSIGRTDLPRGDHAMLISSIRTKIFPLGDNVAFLPGHGPASTVGEERASNPFLA
jgi:glyoxylase-like metal-dependent hydrolase (beta-lactamase superfamily II)